MRIMSRLTLNQSVKNNVMTCKHCEILTHINDNGIDFFFFSETRLSANGDESKINEFALSGFDVK